MCYVCQNANNIVKVHLLENNFNNQRKKKPTQGTFINIISTFKDEAMKETVSDDNHTSSGDDEGDGDDKPVGEREYLYMDDYDGHNDQYQSDDNEEPFNLQDSISRVETSDNKALQRQKQTELVSDDWVSQDSVVNIATALTNLFDTLSIDGKVTFIVCGIGKNYKGFLTLLAAIESDFQAKDLDVYFYVIDKDEALIKKVTNQIGFVNLKDYLIFYPVNIIFESKKFVGEELSKNPANAVLTFSRGLNKLFYYKLAMFALAAGVSHIISPKSLVVTDIVNWDYHPLAKFCGTKEEACHTPRDLYYINLKESIIRYVCVRLSVF